MYDHPGIKKIREVRSLCDRVSARRKSGLFVIEGERLCREALPEDICETYISESYKASHPKAKADYLLTDAEFAKLSDTKHPQGILITARQKRYRMEDLLGGELYLLLETIQDPGNLGTIMRTAEAAGVSAVMMSADCVDIYSPKVTRATMGAIFRVPFIYVEDIAGAAGRLREDGVTVYAGHLDGTPMDGIRPAERRAFMIGNEGAGLKEKTAAAADRRIRIPMKGATESLNAAVCAALFTYWGTI